MTPTWAKLLFLLTITWLTASATTISFIGPDNPTTGLPCNPTDLGCIAGDPANYAIYGLQLTQPTGAGQPWTVTIETNFPPCNPSVGSCTPGHSIENGNVIPDAAYTTGGLYSIPDILIHSNNTDYGVVLATHVINSTTLNDGYAAGNLYQAPNATPDELTAGAVGIAGSPARANIPVYLAPGGSLLGTGTVSVVNGGNGTPAEYTITDTFFAPANFLSTGSFSITASSFPCANGVILGTGSFVGTTGGFVPEPSTFLLSFPALLLFARRFARKTRS